MESIYWKRVWLFVKFRIFAVLSFLLLDNRTCGQIRSKLLGLMGAKVGERCHVRGGLTFQEGFKLKLGNNVFINSNCTIDTSAPVIIGDNVQLAFQVTLVTGGHEIGPSYERAGRHMPRPIIIGDGAWLGARSTVLPGVMIGKGSVVAAGAVVTRNVPDNVVVAGVPARVVRCLPDDNTEAPKLFEAIVHRAIEREKSKPILQPMV